MHFLIIYIHTSYFRLNSDCFRVMAKSLRHKRLWEHFKTVQRNTGFISDTWNLNRTGVRSTGCDKTVLIWKGKTHMTHWEVWQDKTWRHHAFTCVTRCNVMCKASFPGAVKWYKVTSFFISRGKPLWVESGSEFPVHTLVKLCCDHSFIEIWTVIWYTFNISYCCFLDNQEKGAKRHYIGCWDVQKLQKQWHSASSRNNY